MMNITLLLSSTIVVTFMLIMYFIAVCQERKNKEGARSRNCSEATREQSELPLLGRGQ